MRLMATIVMTVVLMVGGCAPNATELTTEGVEQETGVSQLGSISPDGRIGTAYQGIGASAYLSDDQGSWGFGPGPMTTINMTQGRSLVNSPKDVTLKGLKWNPAEGTLEVEELTASASGPITAQTPGLQSALETLQGMSETERAAMVESVKEVSPAASNVLMALIQMLAGM